MIQETDETTDPVFLGNIYHNRAVAAANNMDLDDAKSFFLKAYELNNNPDSLRSYFYIVAITGDTASLRTEIRHMGLEDEYLEEIMTEIGDSKDDVREMTIFAMLQRAAYNKMNKDMADYEIGDSKDDVREMTIFAMLQRAAYNKMNKDMADYDKRMDIILSELKDDFREQAI